MVEQVMHMQAALENSVTRTLALALSTLGSLERLAQHLGVTERQVIQWIEGEGKPPIRVYMKALDLVASGPFSRRL
jgi:DNA-binding transcriptional regulator YdaS (Cro superfamily)